MSKVKNPTELVDRYLQAVRFWLPKDQHQDDLVAELGEDIRSQIEDRQAELGRPVTEEDVSAILKRCGQPMIVAGRLGPQRHLIGPALYPIYIFVMKMVLFWILVPVFLFIVGPANLASAGSWTNAAAATLGNLLYAWFMAAATITLVFVVVEHTHAHAAIACKWDPSTLPPVHPRQRKHSFGHSLSEMVFGYFGLFWLLLLPHYPVLILGPAALFLKAAPALRVFYVPLVVLSVLALLRSTIILARPYWTRFPLPALLTHELLTFILLTIVLNGAGSPHGADWHPFVVLTPSLANSVRYATVPGIVNVSILISVLIWWFAMAVAIIVHAWQLIQQARAKNSHRQPTPSLQAQ